MFKADNGARQMVCGVGRTGNEAIASYCKKMQLHAFDDKIAMIPFLQFNRLQQQEITQATTYTNLGLPLQILIPSQNNAILCSHGYNDTTI